LCFRAATGIDFCGSFADIYSIKAFFSLRSFELKAMAANQSGGFYC
jgi:hypothetical protein